MQKASMGKSSASLASKRSPQQWTFPDIVSGVFFFFLILFFLFIFTPLRDSLPTQSILGPKQRHRLIAAIQSGNGAGGIKACPSGMVDHMPCEDPRRNSQLSRDMNFYRERHCPLPDDTPLCLIPPPKAYQIPVPWPQSLHKIYHANMPHNKIADRKGHQGWMKEEGDYFIFPGGGTMFPEGAVPYIQKLKQYIPIGSGVLRTALDMGCGVASWGGYMLDEGLLALSFAPRDSHKAQIQFALERGIPAIVLMLGTRRLPFPAFSFDMIHCSRCLIPFTAYNATYFMEVDRLLRPGGYLVISGPPVRWSKQEKEWADLQGVAKALCYELIIVDGNTAIWKKPNGDTCLPNHNDFSIDLCDQSDDPSYAWYFKLKKCVSRMTSVGGKYAIGKVPKWPNRLTKAPSRAMVLQGGDDLFKSDTQLWRKMAAYYKSTLNVKLGTSKIRNVMDMNAFLGGFAAAIISEPVWVMNVVPANKPLTLDVIYDRGLIGVYHDWCEPFSTYPRSYDLIHVTGIQSLIRSSDSDKSRCNLVDLLLEMDRILRPEGTAVIHDSVEVIEKVARICDALRWEAIVHDKEAQSHDKQRILVATKTFWKLS